MTLESDRVLEALEEPGREGGGFVEGEVGFSILTPFTRTRVDRIERQGSDALPVGYRGSRPHRSESSPWYSPP